MAEMKKTNKSSYFVIVTDSFSSIFVNTAIKFILSLSIRINYDQSVLLPSEINTIKLKTHSRNIMTD